MELLDKFNVHICDDFTQFVDRNDIVITDTNLFKAYQSSFEGVRVIVIDSGEDSKTMLSVELICRKLVDFEADRSTRLLGFGGGLITDITGFVASIYMRGIDFSFISTSMLGQLDASLGGKNGVNLDGYKNMIGVFNNPFRVVCALDTLGTLPKRELISGYAEAIKCGILADRELFNAFKGEVIDNEFIVKKSLNIKADVVLRDPKETLGVRKLLNLGHTFAHAIEKCAPNLYLHGEAVAIGLCYAAKASLLLGLLDKSIAKEVLDTVRNVGLPVETDLDSHAMAQAMLVDKKRNADKVDFILFSDIASPVVHPVLAQISVIEQFLVSLRTL